MSKQGRVVDWLATLLARFPKLQKRTLAVCRVPKQAPRRIHRSARLIIGAASISAAALSSAQPARATEYQWNNTTGAWSDVARWLSGLPVSDPTTSLSFAGGANASYTATNDFASTPFVLNRLAHFSESTLAPTLAGNAIRFEGINPLIDIQAAGRLFVNLPIAFPGQTLVAGSGSGTIVLNGALSGSGGIFKSGPSVLLIGVASAGVPSANTFHGGITLGGGTLAFFNDADTGKNALRSNRIQFTDDSSLLTGASEIRFGEVNGTGGTIHPIAVAPAALDGQNITISALGDATFGGAVSTAPGIGSTVDGQFTVRGIATQTLTGSLAINNDVIVGHGAGLTLAGAASLGAATNGSVVLQGGVFTLDNRVVNNNNRLRDGDSSSTGLETISGGAFRLIGNAAGSSETLGRLQLGSATKARSGNLNVDVVHTAGNAAATVLSFAGYQRHSGDSPRNTVDFSAHDENGATLPLGLVGANPRIIIGGTVNLRNGLISRSNSTANDNIGWATVNGRDFATHTIAGIAPVITAPFPAATSPTTNALLTGDGEINGDTAYNLNSLKIAPTGPGQSLKVNGAGVLATNGLLLAGEHDYSIVNGPLGTGGLGGPGGSRYIHVEQAVLTMGIALASDNSVAKAGQGLLALTNPNNNLLQKSLTINAGTVRATPGTSLVGGKVEFRGGVLEITGVNTYSPTVGGANGNINWRGDISANPPDPLQPGVSDVDKGSGGFAAFGNSVTIDLNGNGPTDFNWEQPYFVDSNTALVFGSTRANARVTLVDNINLTGTGTNYSVREMRVVDNPGSTTDFARISGVISGSLQRDLAKVGDGILELTGANTFQGGVIVGEGSLMFNNSSGLGANNDNYVLLGARGGNRNAGLLASHTTGSITLSRPIHIQSGGTGVAFLGNSIAPDAATVGNVDYTGNVDIGISGMNIGKDVILVAAPNSQVTLSGRISATPGYTGPVSLVKAGQGVVTISGPQSYTPGASILAVAGVLNLATDAGARGKPDLTSAGANAVLNLMSTQHAFTLNANGGGGIVITGSGNAIPPYLPGNHYVSTQGIFINSASGSYLDIADQALILDYTGGASPTAAIHQLVASGANFSGTPWTGAGIRSSAARDDAGGLTAIGIIDNGVIGYDSIKGSQFGNGLAGGDPIPAQSLLLKWTYVGDTDLNGVVDGDDLVSLLVGYANHGSTWDTGDFDYNGVVDGDDLVSLLVSYSNQGGKLGAGAVGPASAAVVPEPASWTLLAIATAGLWSLARRKIANARLVSSSPSSRG